MESKSKYSLFAISLTICLLVISCASLGNNERKVIKEYHYSFEPNSIFQSITSAQKEMFSPISNDSEQNRILLQPIAWPQSDYLKIANAFHKFVWKESIEDWNLNSMSFSSSCAEIEKGFQNASFSFLNKSKNGNRDISTEHQIDIYPDKKLINAWEFVYNSGFIQEQSLKASIPGMITANEALDIAEKNGGQKERTAIDNKCDISIILSPNPRGKYEWAILYSPEVFSVRVDPITGKPVK